MNNTKRGDEFLTCTLTDLVDGMYQAEWFGNVLTVWTSDGAVCFETLESTSRKTYLGVVAQQGEIELVEVA